jgi:hypothetical protein
MVVAELGSLAGAGSGGMWNVYFLLNFSVNLKLL